MYEGLVDQDGTEFDVLIEKIKGNRPEKNRNYVLQLVNDFFADGNYSLLQGKLVKSRTTHECSWCSEKINKGEEYVYAAVKFEGDSELFVYKVCPDCLIAQDVDIVLQVDDIIEHRCKTGFGVKN